MAAGSSTSCRTAVEQLRFFEFAQKTDDGFVVIRQRGADGVVRQDAFGHQVHPFAQRNVHIIEQRFSVVGDVDDFMLGHHPDNMDSGFVLMEFVQRLEVIPNHF